MSDVTSNKQSSFTKLNEKMENDIAPKKFNKKKVSKNMSIDIAETHK